MNGFPVKYPRGQFAVANGIGGWVPLSAVATGSGLLQINAGGAPSITVSPTLDAITATGSGGLLIKNSSGTTVATIGAGPGTGVTLAGALAIGGALSGVTTLTASSTTILGTDPGGSELLRVGGAIRASGGCVFATPSSFSTLTLGDNSSASYSGLRLKGNNLQFNWQISTSNTISSALEFAISTAAAGSTYAAPAMYLNSSGALILGTDPGGSDLCRIGGALTISSATMLTTKTSFTNGAAAATGTLTNAPVAGNPTKWAPVDDNGTIRYVPMW